MKVFFSELMRTQTAHGNVSRAGFAKLDVSDGMPRVLYHLNGHQGVVQKELAVLCRVKESTLAVLLRRMEEKGLIRKERVTRSGGKRAFGIYMTEAGEEKTREIIRFVSRVDAKCLEGFSDEEVEQFYSFMERVQRNLNGYSPEV